MSIYRDADTGQLRKETCDLMFGEPLNDKFDKLVSRALREAGRDERQDDG